MLNNKTVLITGGTGSFGKRCAEMLLEKFKLKKLIIFSRDELKQFEMSEQINSLRYQTKVSYFLGDVRDKERLHRAFQGVDVIIHAAAMKQVPASEYNPFEAIKTNIIGAQNIINVAIDQKIGHVIALSTDKAVNPINLYGATKLCSDKLFIASNSYVGEAGTRFSVVRYGNVIGSRGSVIPFFLRERIKGVLPITDERMTRFFISIENAVEFVIRSLDRMKGGEIFIPKLPSIKITDLAKAISPEAKLEIVGIRPGEKIHEVLIAKDDATNTYEFEDYFTISPPITWLKKIIEKGDPVKPEFVYRSDLNEHWLTIEDIRKTLTEQKLL